MNDHEALRLDVDRQLKEFVDNGGRIRKVWCGASGRDPLKIGRNITISDKGNRGKQFTHNNDLFSNTRKRTA